MPVQITHPWFALWFTLSVGLFPVVALGQPAGDAKAARADALFEQGKAAMAAGKIGEGCTAFDQSYEQDPRVTTLANLANCREKNQQLATALRHFSAVARELQGTTDPGGVALRELATQRVASLTPRVPRLTLQVAEAGRPAGLEVLRDGVSLPPEQWGQVQLLDGGDYQFSARAPGHQRWDIKVTLRAEADARSLDVPALLPVVVRDQPVAERGPLVEAPRRRSLVLPVSLGVAALALGGVAVGVDLAARRLQDDAESLADQGRFVEAVDQNDRANTRRHQAQGIGVLAGVCAGAAVYFYFSGRSAPSPTATASRRITPVVGRGVAGMALVGSW